MRFAPIVTRIAIACARRAPSVWENANNEQNNLHRCVRHPRRLRRERWQPDRPTGTN
jgi:hypothetical protein